MKKLINFILGMSPIWMPIAGVILANKLIKYITMDMIMWGVGILFVVCLIKLIILERGN